MRIFEVDEENFHVVMDGEFSRGQIVILKFGSEFCEACSALDMELEQLSSKNDKISIVAVNTDQSPEIAEEYDVYQLPTMIIYKNKETILHDAEGVILSEDIQKIIDSRL
ncbi:hypothetical protein SMGD1_2353 [Sulfurimonas gotlandica GD1]|uniref:Thioredoxin domain-containing protein n=1 Tax=Sulfurimonas gotlandica (strain DSM 19862 / JCM 16533 / GD1) TaxID=929558 RepID=H1FYR1_SULGG|nr:thioredoxin family protein [Sulfurimonas gotlandica]EHP30876.1 hypothetical protein SMGD1_2353 [Sulfurimonas gotlandica GD1]